MGKYTTGIYPTLLYCLIREEKGVEPKLFIISSELEETFGREKV